MDGYVRFSRSDENSVRQQARASRDSRDLKFKTANIISCLSLFQISNLALPSPRRRALVVPC